MFIRMMSVLFASLFLVTNANSSDLINFFLEGSVKNDPGCKKYRAEIKANPPDYSFCEKNPCECKKRQEGMKITSKTYGENMKCVDVVFLEKNFNCGGDTSSNTIASTKKKTTTSTSTKKKTTTLSSGSSTSKKTTQVAKKYEFGDVLESSNQHIIFYSKGCWSCNVYEISRKAEGHCDRFKKNVYGFSMPKGNQYKGFEFYACGKDSSEANNIYYDVMRSPGELVWEEEKYEPSEEDKRVEKFAKLISFCERELGFKKGTDANGDCALKIYQTETALTQSGAQANSSDALARQMNLNNSLMLMQQGLKMMNPPQPKLNCTTTHLGWTCY